MEKITQVWESLNVAEIGKEDDTFALSFVKGSVNAGVKIALVGGLLHIVEKGIRHIINNRNSSEEAGE